jgi:glucan phosphoethanolaminetransferase (alkaline phosphatase superfamily)
MKLWAALYGMIWVVLIEFLLAMKPGLPTAFLYLHVLIGFVIVAIAYSNFIGLRDSRAPGRLKRTARATFALSILMVFLGILLFLNLGSNWSLPLPTVSVYDLILFLHIVNAVAIVTQAAAVAVAYDMWEEREFDRESEPGRIPPAPSPAVAGPPQGPRGSA